MATPRASGAASRRAAPKREIWHPADYTAADIRAIQALALYARGADHAWPAGQEPPVPSPSDVKRALDWIVNHAAQTYEDPFRPGQADVASYVMGRGSVGRQIVKLMKIRPAAIDQLARREREVAASRQSSQGEQPD